MSLGRAFLAILIASHFSISSAYSTGVAAEGLLTLMRSTQIWRGRVFGRIFNDGRGWANHWAHQKWGPRPSGDYERLLGTLGEGESDVLLSRLLLGGQGNSQLHELRRLHEGLPRRDHQLWSRIFRFRESPRRPKFEFEGATLRMAAYEHRPQIDSRARDVFSDGMVFRRFSTTSDGAEFWVRIREHDVQIPADVLPPHNSLTLYSATHDFQLGDRGLAVLGSRFTVAKNHILQIDGGTVRVLNVSRGHATVAPRTDFTIETHPGGEILSLGDSVRGVSSSAKLVGIARSPEGLQILTWQTRLESSKGVSGPQTTKVLQPRDLVEGALVTGVRISELKLPGDGSVVAVDYVSPRGRLRTAYFDFDTLLKVKLDGF